MSRVDIDLSDKVAVITGGSRGLGMSIAKAMAARGAHVVICGRKQENLDQAMEEFHKNSLEIMALPVNVGKLDQVEALFDAVDRLFVQDVN